MQWCSKHIYVMYYNYTQIHIYIIGSGGGGGISSSFCGSGIDVLTSSVVVTLQTNSASVKCS